ncbi:Dipeptide transport system permease protein DppB [compost metagenome]
MTVAGAILTETIFSWPGIGRFLVTSVLSRDYPVIQIVILFIGVFILIVNIILEILVKIIDPKQRVKV